MVDFQRDALVSTQWLADNLGAPDLRVVDASYYLPGEGLDPRREFEAQHIPGAVFFDIDDIKDPDSDLPTCCRRRTSFPPRCAASASATGCAW
jgi:thiosulfate/3-mercaptopyruvate sulfurtransferase